MTALDVFGADLGTTGHQAVSPVPDLVRVAVVGEHRQIDLHLPLDVPLALLVPEIVGLCGARSGVTPAPAGGAEDRPRDVVWELRSAESGPPLAPDGTLRGAGVARDDVLYLRGRPTSAAPTLYDDVVDAAARLNQSRHAGWHPAAARCVAHLGVSLAAAALGWLVLVDASSPRRAALLGLSAFVTVTLAVVAAIVTRSGGTPRNGAVLGGACLPVAAAGCWAGLSPYGSLALAGGASALVVLCVAQSRLIGAGTAGFAAAGTFFACGAVGLAVHGSGVSGFRTAVCLAVAATVATLAVPRLTGRWDYAPSDPPPDGGDLGRHVARARARRAGLSAGLGAAACAAGVTILRGGGELHWATMAFDAVCAAALGLPRPGVRSGVQRAASGLPAVALFVAVAVAAVRGDQFMSVAGAAALVAGALLLAGVGARSGSVPRRRWWPWLSLGSYLAFSAVVPSAVWAVAAHAGWGVQ